MEKSLNKLHSLSSLGVIPAERGDIRVERLEDRKVPKVPFPHKHDFFQIVVIAAGKGWHEVDFTRHKLARGQVYILKPGQVHTWQLSKDTRGFVIEFTQESLPHFLTGHFLTTLRQLPDCVQPKTVSTEFLHMMQKEFEDKPAYFQFSLQNYLRIFLVQLMRENLGKEGLPEPQASLTDAFLDLVEKYFREEHRLQFYADRLKVSAKTLSAQVQRALGKPAKEILLERCLLEARRLLAFTDMPVAQISYDLGFEDPNYFSRFLKTYGGLTALDFRKRTQNLSKE